MSHEPSNVLRPSAWRRSFRRPWLIASVLLTIVTLVVLIFSPGFIYKHVDEVDIRSGRVRRTDYSFFIRSHRSIESSALSDALGETGRGSSPDWHIVNTFEGRGRVSPHYNFHGAIAQIRWLEELWRLVPFTPEAKWQVAMTVLERWQTGGSYWAAEEYIRAVEDLAGQPANIARPIGIAQLPTTTHPSPKP